MRHIVTLVLAFGFYLLLAGQVNTETLIAAAVMSAVTLASALAIRHVADRPVAFSRAHVAPWLRALAKLPGDTLRIGVCLTRAALAGGSPGRGVTTPFHFGTIEDADSRGRRATAVLAGSLTPDTFIVHIAPGRGDAITHRLLGPPDSARPEWLA